VLITPTHTNTNTTPSLPQRTKRWYRQRTKWCYHQRTKGCYRFTKFPTSSLMCIKLLFPLHFPTKICVLFSPVRCISSAYRNLICFRLVFQTPSFGLATLLGRLLRDTSYLTLRTTEEGERTFCTPAYTLCHLVEVLLASTVWCLSPPQISFIVLF